MTLKKTSSGVKSDDLAGQIVNLCVIHFPWKWRLNLTVLNVQNEVVLCLVETIWFQLRQPEFRDFGNIYCLGLGTPVVAKVVDILQLCQIAINNEKTVIGLYIKH
jgi:hypothetical protein